MRMWARLASAAGSAVIALACGVGVPGGTAVAQAVRTEVPAREAVSPRISHYSRVRPQIAAAGTLADGALAELKSLGFAAILDLRAPQEGTEIEKRNAAAAGLRYHNIPVTTAVPTDAQLVEFARIVEDAGNRPLLIHCASANRVGTAWALYLARTGTPVAAALAEGRAIGMQPPRESAIRAQLGLPAGSR